MALLEYINILVAIIFLFFLFLCQYNYWIKNRSSKSFLTNWPVVGMLPGLLTHISRPLDGATEAILHHGGTAEFKGPWFPRFDFIMTSDPMNINHILCRRFHLYDENGFEFNEICFDALGDGIFNADSDSWKIQRKILMSLMHSDKFVRHVRRIVWEKLERRLLPLLEHFMKLDVELDLQEVFQRFNYDAICFFVLGSDLNSITIEFPHVPTKSAFDQAEKVLLYRHLVPHWFWKLQRWLQIGEEKKMKKALETADNFTYQCILEKREQLRSAKSQVLLKEEDDDFVDMLTAFMVENKGGRHDDEMAQMRELGKSDKFLRDLVINLLGAGKDTVTSSLCWFFWLIATNPSTKNKIVQEMEANLAPTSSISYHQIGREELNKFIYLHAALCETLRLYPAVPYNHKTPNEADTLPSGHRIGKKTRVLLNFYAMGRMKEIWGEDCLDFKPERWISEQGDSIIQVPSYKFTAFNAGRRTCLGKDLSFIQLKMIAIAILWRYEIEVVNHEHPPCPMNSVVLLMKDAFKVKIKKRVLLSN